MAVMIRRSGFLVDLKIGKIGCKIFIRIYFSRSVIFLRSINLSENGSSRFTLMLPLNATFYGRKSALDNGEIKIREYNYQQDHKP